MLGKHPHISCTKKEVTPSWKQRCEGGVSHGKLAHCNACVSASCPADVVEGSVKDLPLPKTMSVPLEHWPLTTKG
eukprot:15095655-Ditylum_brightwellii.AAC.1